MRMTYDDFADALYIELSEGIVSSTREYDNGTFVDVDSGGNALGIEILRPARPLPLDDIIDDFAVAESTAEVLRSMWADVFPYSPSWPQLAASA